jgi:hypothetical protein
MYLLYEAQIMPFTKKLICGTTFIDLIPILKKKIDEEKSIEELIKENEILKERIKQLEK